jgi:NAD dependent epimerase/dehydratase
MTATVAVTGADGFIGSHLVETLVHAGYRVRALAQYNSFGSWGWLDEVDQETMGEVEVVPGDIRDRESVHSLLTGAESVCHLAALIAIPYSYTSPSSYIETNVVGTLNVLEVARSLGLARLICTSTSEVYGTALTVPIGESHPLQAQSPYAASKIAADKLAESYHLSFDLPVVTLRPFNTFGPRQSARAVIPTVISQLAAGRRRIELGSLVPTRDFNFVKDTAEAFLATLEAPAEDVIGRTFNAGSGREISIADVVEIIGQVMGRPAEVVLDEQRIRPDNSEVLRLVCDSSALQAVTAWKPEHTLEEALRLTADWFSDSRNLSRYKVDRYNI